MFLVEGAFSEKGGHVGEADASSFSPTRDGCAKGRGEGRGKKDKRTERVIRKADRLTRSESQK